MVDLAEEGRALLALARDADDPSEADRARVRAALAAQLGAAAGLGTAAGLCASAAKAAVAAADAGGLAGAGAATLGKVAVGGTLATKLIGAAIVVAATVGGGAAAVHHARRPLAARQATAAPITAVRQAPPAAASQQARSLDSHRDEREGAPPSAGATPVTWAPQGHPRTPARRAVTMTAPMKVVRPLEAPGPDAPEMPAAPTAVAAPVPRAPEADSGLPAPVAQRLTPTVEGEVRLVRDGVAALRAGAPARALALFDAHALRYPRGVLAEERAVERALALDALGRHAEARAAADEFLRAHPTSPLATRLRRSIPASPGGR